MKQAVSGLLGCLFPYPGIFVCICLKFGTIDIQMLQIHMFCFKDLLVDIVEYLFDGIFDHFIDKVAECPVRRGFMIHKVHLSLIHI